VEVEIAFYRSRPPHFCFGLFPIFCLFLSLLPSFPSLATSANADGIFEPGEAVLIENIRISNRGGLPLPGGGLALISAPSTDTFICTHTPRPIADTMPAGASIVLPPSCALSGRIPDAPPVSERPPVCAHSSERRVGILQCHDSERTGHHQACVESGMHFLHIVKRPCSPPLARLYEQVPYEATSTLYLRVDMFGRPFEQSFFETTLPVQYPVRFATCTAPPKAVRCLVNKQEC